MKNNLSFSIRIKSRKSLIGVVLGLLAFAACTLFYKASVGGCLLVVFAVIGTVKIEFNCKFIFIKWLHILVVLVGTFYAAQYSLLNLNFNLSAEIIFYNVLGIAALCAFFSVIFTDEKEAIVLGTIVYMGFIVTNNLVYQCRGREFVPSDFYAARTAFNVIGQYNLSINARTFYALSFWVAMLFSLWSVDYYSASGSDKTNKSGLLRRAARLACCIAMVIAFINECTEIHVLTWDTMGTEENGFILNFGAEVLDVIRATQKGSYSVDDVLALEKQYRSSDNTKNKTEKHPHIVVVMNESFADLQKIGNMGLSTEIMPFIDSLNENTIHGYALASVFGGGTSNSEYELLTGNSMGFFKQNPIVYQEYLKNRSYSMATFLHDLGYYCVATHPYYGSGWARTAAWPFLGFDEISFLDDYPQQDLIRNYVSDSEMYGQIINTFKSKTGDDPLFVFGVTMQNHGGYDVSEDAFPSEDFVGSAYPDVNQYLQLIRISDASLEKMISFFQKYEEDVVLLFFGDHFPKLSSSFYESLNHGPIDTLEEIQNQYTVPFFIWANYDIEEKEITLTSLNYLSSYLMETAGIELPPYNRFLRDVELFIPAMNSQGFINADYECKTYSEANEEETELLKKYRTLEYNSLFDTKNRSSVFFGTD